MFGAQVSAYFVGCISNASLIFGLCGIVLVCLVIWSQQGFCTSLTLLPESVEALPQVRLLGVSRRGIGMARHSYWNPSYSGVSVWGRRDKEPSRTRYLLWLHPSFLFHPPTSVSLGESRESQAQWGRRLLLSTIVGGTPDDSPLPVCLAHLMSKGLPLILGSLWVKRHKTPCLSVVSRVPSKFSFFLLFK